jgi:hypothetical protein
MFLLLPLATYADDTPVWLPARPHGADAAAFDLQLLLRARQALEQDESLGAYGLGVSVRDRVATLWGQVPNEAVSERARERLRQVPGLSAVRAQVHVQPEKSAADVARLWSLKDRVPLSEPVESKPMRSQRAMACSPWTPRRDALDYTGEDTPAPPRSVNSLASSTILNAIPPSAEPLLPPLHVPAAPLAKTQAASDLDRAVQTLQQSDLRFRRVVWQVRGRVVTLRGTVSSWDDVYDLARLLSRLPGVERVVLEAVHRDAGR